MVVSSKEEVEATFERAVAAGAKVTSPIRNRDGGLYTGYFTDPEDNAWEIVWSPHMGLDERGSLTLGG